MPTKQELNLQKQNSIAFFKFNSAIKKDTTRESYHIGLDQFLIFSNIGYDDIIKLETPKIHELMERWLISLNNRKLKYQTAHLYLSAVELFLEMNMILWHKKVIRKMLPSSDYVAAGGVAFTNDDISNMLKITKSLRNIALVLFLSSTGMRPGALEDPILTVSHLGDMPLGCKSVRVYDESKSGYWAFLTPEASRALDRYLNSRKINGEILTLESPIFATQNESKVRKHLNKQNAGQIVKNLINRSGVQRKIVYNDAVGRPKYDKAESYGFRKRFNTILKIDNTVNSNIAEKLMAHKKGLDGSYLTPTIDECFNEFSKAIPELTIDDSMRKDFALKKKEKQIQDLEQVLKEKDELLGRVETLETLFKLGFTPKVDS